MIPPLSAGVILLTAAVQPNPAFSVVVHDPKQRLRQYVSAISSWVTVAKRKNYSVAVVETSSFDLASELDPSLGVRVIPHSPTNAAVRGGKGAIEAEAMEPAIESIVETYSLLCSVFKVTGRLMIAEPEALLTPLGTETFRVRRTLDRSFCDTRILGFTAGGWAEWLVGMQAEVQDSGGRYLEHVVAQRLVIAEYEGAIVRSFAHKPRFIGQSGTSGNPYNGIVRGKPASLLSAAEGRLARFSQVKQW